MNEAIVNLIILAFFIFLLLFVLRKLYGSTSGCLTSSCGIRVILSLIVLILLIMWVYTWLRRLNFGF